MAVVTFPGIAEGWAFDLGGFEIKSRKGDALDKGAS